MTRSFQVALTFDAEHPDRPTVPGVTEGILDELARLDVRATFFVQGRWAEANPALARRIHGDGHLVGSHSFYHVRLPLLSDVGLAEDVATAERAILEHAGVSPRPWFRCPFGEGADDPRVLAALAGLGYRNVGWDVDPADWDPGRTAGEVEEAVVAGALARGDGAIVLLHAWPDRTLAALPGIVRRLRDAGALFVRLDEALGAGRPEVTGAVRADPGGLPLVLAADVGNSKTDLALLRADGELLAAVRGPTASHQAVGLDAGADALDALLSSARASAGLDPAARPGSDLAVVCAAGADFPDEVRRLAHLYERRGLAATAVVRNDTHAALRAGTDAGWGAAVVCGAGINCLGVAPDGREARFAALGPTSGDWGGGGALGMAALAAAVRARDGRGPRTALERLVPARFGLRRPIDVTLAIYRGHLDEERILDLAPDVFAAAGEGDAVARAILDRLADEVALMAVAALRRLHLLRRRPPVVLAGGVFRADDDAFLRRIAEGVERVAPGALVERLTAPPVLGAALLALDRLDRPDRLAAGDLLRATLTQARLAAAR